MSELYFGISGYGMFLNTSERDAFCRAYGAANQIATENKYGDDFSEVTYELDCSDLTDGSFEGRDIRHLDGKPHEKDGDDFCEGLFLYADRQGSIFGTPGRCYRNIHEMADEFRQKYAVYLPEDFGFEAHMAFFLGALSC